MYKHIQQTGFHAEVGNMGWDIEQAIEISLQEIIDSCDYRQSSADTLFQDLFRVQIVCRITLALRGAASEKKSS